MAHGVTRTRLERIGDEREKAKERLTDLQAMAEDDGGRPLNETEEELAAKHRTDIANYDSEIRLLAGDIEADQQSLDISELVRPDTDVNRTRINVGNEPVVYRSFAEYARDQLITHPEHGAQVLSMMGGDKTAIVSEAQERLERTLQNTTSTTVAGLIVPTHMTQIMDIIDRSRPVWDSGRQVPLDRGSMTYPIIGTRPTVVEQTSEKTEAGTVAPTVSSGTLTAKTYLGATNVSWQAVNWSTPDVLSLYFDLAAEAYARQTEGRACDVLEDAAIGTVGTASGRLGTAGTESFSQWRAALVAGLQGIYSATSGRHMTNTLYLSANRFFQLAALGTEEVTSMSPVGGMDMGTMRGKFLGLDIIGSYGFDQDVAIVGDRGALLCGENAGNPVEMRVVEPAIGGWEVGLIGAANCAVFDVNRFYHLGTHL